MELDVINQKGEKIDTLRLADGFITTPVNKHLVYLSLKAYLDNNRRGTVKTKGRSEVRGGGRKPWRQKGTGRSRQGTIRSPLWKGGGVVFGPRPRSYSHNLSKKERHNAMRSVLSMKFSENSLVVIDAFSLPENKTREAVNFLKRLSLPEGKSTVLVTQNLQVGLYRAFANIPRVDMISLHELCTYDILNHDLVVIESEALKTLQGVLWNGS